MNILVVLLAASAYCAVGFAVVLLPGVVCDRSFGSELMDRVRADLELRQVAEERPVTFGFLCFSAYAALMFMWPVLVVCGVRFLVRDRGGSGAGAGGRRPLTGVPLLGLATSQERPGALLGGAP